MVLILRKSQHRYRNLYSKQFLCVKETCVCKFVEQIKSFGICQLLIKLCDSQEKDCDIEAFSRRSLINLLIQ